MAARNKGTCDNRLNIRADRLDEIVLSGLKQRLMDPAIYAEFMAGDIEERNTILAGRNAHFAAAEAELARLEQRKRRIIDAMAVVRYAKPGRKSASTWLLQLLERRPHKIAAIALANKIARIIWAMMARGEAYRRQPAAA